MQAATPLPRIHFLTMISPNESHETQGIARRRILGTLGLTGLGMLVATTTSRAASPGKISASPKVSVPTSSGNTSHQTLPFSPVPELPEAWAAQNGALAAEYLRYLTGLNLKFVCARQVMETHAKQHGSVWNSLPPKQWWNRMGYVLKVVDRIALEMNVNQVEVISAYRSPAYNATCPGAKCGSWHQANVAADVKFPVPASKVTATARELRDLGLFRGGVGGYWNFTHIDARGQNVNWQG
jgi:hypothetical protein